MANNLGMVFANRIERNSSTISPSAEPAASLDEFSFGFEGWGDRIHGSLGNLILLRLPNLSIKFQSIQRIWPINQSIQSEGFKKSNQSSIECSD